MGRTSKFLFPIPRRKSQSNRAQSREKEPPPPPTPGLSKAQRILGTDGGLNIDGSLGSPRADEQPWMTKSNEMSISISESTDGSDDEETWDAESGVLRVTRLKAKPSSTLLGQNAATEELTDTSSLKGSSSTFKSYYDRKKNPLLISQQTSSSSARDLALRKGMAVVAGPQRRCLVGVDCADEEKKGGLRKTSTTSLSESSATKSPKKRPGRLDISKLFPKPRQDITNPTLLGPDALTQSPSALSFVSSTHNTYLFPRPSHSATPVSSSLPQECQLKPIVPNSTLTRIKPQYSVQSLQERYSSRRKGSTSELPLAAIPKRSSSRNLYATNIAAGRAIENLTGPQLMALHTPPPSLDSSASPKSKQSQFSWKHVRASIGGASSSATWDSGSAISISSRNTRASKRTTASAFEMVDLKNHSVLSLSSSEDDSEEEADQSLDGRLQSPQSKQSNNDSGSGVPAEGGIGPAMGEERASGQIRETGKQKLPISADHQSPPSLGTEPVEPPPAIRQQLPRLTTAVPKQTRRIGSGKIPKSRFRASQYLPIPNSSPLGVRLSAPWGTGLDSSSANDQIPWNTLGQDLNSGTQGHVKMDTPPLSPAVSPTSVEFRQAPGRSSRFMAVNPQERALLEALRLKRTKMKENSIAEDEELSPRSLGTSQQQQSANDLRNSSRQSDRSQTTFGPGDRDSKQSTISTTGSFQSRSSANTIRGTSHSHSGSFSGSFGRRGGGSHSKKRSTSKGNILLVLEREALDGNQEIQTAEPSPDLAEFYRESFGLGEGYRYYSDDEVESVKKSRRTSLKDFPGSLPCSGTLATRMAKEREDTIPERPEREPEPEESPIYGPRASGYLVKSFNDYDNDKQSLTPTRNIIPPRLSAVGAGPPQYRRHYHQREDSDASIASRQYIKPKKSQKSLHPNGVVALKSREKGRIEMKNGSENSYRGTGESEEMEQAMDEIWGM